MITLRQRALWAGLLATATFTSAGAFAQTPQVAPVPPAAEAMAGADKQAKQTVKKQKRAEHKRLSPAERFERMQAHRAKGQADLKAKLALTPAQEGAWSSFTAASQPPARDANAPRPDRAALAKLTTPERLDRMQARHAERSAMLAKRADATRAFYAVLTPAQQKTFDAESALRGHRHGGHRGHHGGHHGAHEGKPATRAAS
ncbi:MAG: hypothetical protein EOP81_08460 [Variovorax sp.]|nr:MAG: hypothetical protein EOP81_08460 [Variovorax sp.]